MPRTRSLAPLAVLALLATPLPAAAITLDGQLDPDYGAPVIVQTIATNQGDNARGLLTWSDGSELDALHLATMDYLRRIGQEVSLASYDMRLVKGARALGFGIAVS